MVIVFPGDGASQLMVGAVIIACYGLRCAYVLPFEDMNVNRLEIILSLALFSQVSIAAGAGFDSASLDGLEASSFKGNAGVWFLLVSYCGLAVPVLGMLWNVLLSCSCLRKKVWTSMRTWTEDEFQHKKAALISMLSQLDQLTKLVADMDHIELVRLEDALTKAACSPLHLRDSTDSTFTTAKSKGLTALQSRRWSIVLARRGRGNSLRASSDSTGADAGLSVAVAGEESADSSAASWSPQIAQELQATGRLNNVGSGGPDLIATSGGGLAASSDVATEDSGGRILIDL